MLNTELSYSSYYYLPPPRPFRIFAAVRHLPASSLFYSPHHMDKNDNLTSIAILFFSKTYAIY
jgi:hypothetical protein